MKTITLTCFNRPHYLIKTIESLKRNNLLGYDILYINVDSKNNDVIDICYGIDFIKTNIQINRNTLGVRKNPYDVINRAFNNGSDFNFYLEDDCILSPDAFNLSNWYYENFSEDKYLLLSLCNYFNDNSCPIDKVVEYDEFIAISFCFFSFNWFQYIRPFWFKDNIIKNINGVGWDWSIRSVIRKYKLKTLTSLIPRSNHIGITGTYMTPKVQRDLFENKKHNTDRIITDFVFNGDKG